MSCPYLSSIATCTKVHIEVDLDSRVIIKPVIITIDDQYNFKGPSIIDERGRLADILFVGID